MVTYNDVDYFYVYNLQGDVVALIDANGTQVVEYVYDAWGYPISKTGSLAATIGTLNPFRYRGYVYDEETGLYYLRSRYYHPVWKRFITSDLQTGKIGLQGTHNLFSYTLCNPVKYADPVGTFPIKASQGQKDEAQELLDKVGYQLPDGEINSITITPQKYEDYSYGLINVMVIANCAEENNLSTSEIYTYTIAKKSMQVSDFLSEHIVFNSTFANLSDTASSIDPSGLSSMFIGRNFFSFAMGKLLAGWSNITFALSVISELSSSYVQLDEYTAGGQYGHRYICNSKGQIIKIEKIL